MRQIGSLLWNKELVSFMFFRKSNSIVSGLEIRSTSVRFITVALKNRLWHVLAKSEIELPEGVVKPSFNKTNIHKPAEFQDALELLRAKIKKSKYPIGLSLPGESIKFSVKSFPKLPEGKENIRDMILWSIGKSSIINPDTTRVRWAAFKNSKDDISLNESNVIVMAGVASKSVITEYEDSLKNALFIPRAICSSDLNLFNFYSDIIDEGGTVGWIGIFPETLSLFVFKDGSPLFYKNIKKGLITDNDADNIDMLIQYCIDENPDLKIDRYYLSSADTSFNNILSHTIFNSVKYELLSAFDLNSIEPADKHTCCEYASAVGAAWSTLSV